MNTTANFTCGKSGTVIVQIENVNGKLTYKIDGQEVSASQAGVIARFTKKFGYNPSAEEIKANAKTFSTNALRDFVEVESGKCVRDFFGLAEATPKPRDGSSAPKTGVKTNPLNSYLSEKEQASLKALQAFLSKTKEDDDSEIAVKSRLAVGKLVEKAKAAQAADAKAKAELAEAENCARLENAALDALAALDAELALIDDEPQTEQEPQS